MCSPGMVGGLICQGFDLPSSLQISVYLHGLAGDRVACEKGEKSLVATDILKTIPVSSSMGFDFPPSFHFRHKRIYEDIESAGYLYLWKSVKFSREKAYCNQGVYHGYEERDQEIGPN